MIRSVVFSFIVRFASAVLNFLVIVLLSNVLGSEGKGICSRYITIIANALIFCDFIGGPPLVFMAAKYRVSNILLPSYLWSALTSLITIYVFYLLGQFPENELPVMMILSFLNSCIAIHQNILSGKMKFLQLNIVILIQSLVLFLTLKYFFRISGEVFELAPAPVHYLMALGVSYGAGSLIGFLFIVFLEKTGERVRLISFLSEAFRYGFVNILGHALQFINQRLSYFFLQPQSLGVFSNASSIGESLWLIPNSIATVQYGKVSNMPDKKAAEQVSLFFLKLNLLLCFFAVIIMLLLPDSFFIWLFGKEFSGISHLLLLLAPGLFFYGGYLILGHHFSGRGKFMLNLKSIAAGLTVTILGFAYLLIFKKSFTMEEAALLTTVSYSGNFIFAFAVFFRETGISPRALVFTKADLRFLFNDFFGRTKK